MRRGGGHQVADSYLQLAGGHSITANKQISFGIGKWCPASPAGPTRFGPEEAQAYLEISHGGQSFAAKFVVQSIYNSAGDPP